MNIDYYAIPSITTLIDRQNLFLEMFLLYGCLCFADFFNAGNIKVLGFIAIEM